jgi:N-acetylmuramoyl-L-alanine amidase
MMIEAPSPNFDERPDMVPIDMLVIHYTGMESAAAALARLCDPESKVSAHYLVDEDGAVYRLVVERKRAWHAGVSVWRGWTDINARSIGIELVNPGHEFGYRPFPEAQMAAAVDLSCDIVARHKVHARNVVGHSDVAPRRKMDPGEFFDWARLAAAGVGLWPADSEICNMDPGVIADMLARVGYDMSDAVAALKAFQRHFRPERVTGRIDFGSARRLAGLLEACTDC